MMSIIENLSWFYCVLIYSRKKRTAVSPLKTKTHFWKNIVTRIHYQTHQIYQQTTTKQHVNV